MVDKDWFNERFPKVLKALHGQGFTGTAQLRVWKSMRDHLLEHPELFDRAPVFWTLASNALFDSSMLTIARFLDNAKDTATVHYLLNLAEQGLNMFGPRKSLVKDRVESDRALLSTIRAKAVPIIDRRHNVLAHLSRQKASNPKELALMFPVSPEDVERIFDELRMIINAYSGFWDDSETLWQIVGDDDFKHLSRLLTFGHAAEKANREARRRRLKGGARHVRTDGET